MTIPERVSGLEESINTCLWVSGVEGIGSKHGPGLIRSMSAGLNNGVRTAFLIHWLESEVSESKAGGLVIAV